MKKLILALSVLLAIACNTEKKEESNGKTDSTNKSQAKSPVEKTTMNGMSFDEAQEMVKRFLSSRRSSHPTTSIWFDKKFIADILLAQKVDTISGVRFYFAKDGNNNNTVIPVATKNSKTSPSHNDFFEFSQSISYLKPKQENDGSGGGNLYTIKCTGDDCRWTPTSISCSDASAWAKNFMKAYQDKYDIINTTSVWYTIDFFMMLNEKLEAANARGKNADGIRIYFIRNHQHKNGFVFTITNSSGNDHIDDTFCYKLANKFKLRPRIDDRGEECPIFCPGTTWNDCEQ